ncbi:hypothetical protein P5G51_018695 [Virgibacillus sp. 179-BFC.A HS]|uniref:Uncharacterized protein n=1 Tax=Tigheibacillus jepli TaxID=3035914 RepID=A0ABU5CLJ0_9BACI|nr:hypothetical protein [Virgibacillus sp. 179-BFC.A HS]MDY0407090.1 hypothetical protein [Virgibacillus sp. 179-BFC.A HS]MDY0407091.1 hypothetical protein [Virgibacillus sp. 179-BFC.A HS]
MMQFFSRSVVHPAYEIPNDAFFLRSVVHPAYEIPNDAFFLSFGRSSTL